MATYKRKMGIEEDKDSPAYYREREARRINKPSKYDSLRPSGEEERLSTAKREGLKDAALGTAFAPVAVALETALGRSGSNKGPIGAGADHLMGAVSRASKSAKEAADFISSGGERYMSAKDKEEALDRELESQNRREARGMKNGGKVKSASRRGDGIAQRGKTKGRYL
jgi:hypothetical protein